MSAPLRHRYLAELLGSWPFAPTPSFASPQLIPTAIEPSATIIGMRREPVGSFAVGGMNWYLWRDVASVPTQVQIQFSPGNKTLAQVISEINATVGISPSTIAFNDNGFLRLSSPTTGEDSYLRLESIAASENVFFQLGLFAETISRGGEPVQAHSIDPTREVASPGQMFLGQGEPFDTQAMNRLALVLSTNVDRSAGLLDQRIVGIKKREAFAGAGAASIRLNNVNPAEGVYTGAVATPDEDELLDTLVVLDEDGNEFTQEYRYQLVGGLTDLTFTINADSGETIVTSATATFATTDVAEDVYIAVSNFAVAVSLNNVPLKITRRISATQAVVMPLDPATGLSVSITESNRSGARFRIYNVRAEIDGLYSDAGLTTRVEQVNVTAANSTGTVDRVERNNRVVVDDAGVDFTVAVRPGHEAVWSGSSSDDPWSNDGTYRVLSVIDPQTLELVDGNFGPVIFNPNAGGGYGSLTVRSDGEFFPRPYARFAQPSLVNLQAGRGAIPQTGNNFQVVYLVGRTLRGALESDPTALTSSPRFDQETIGKVAAAIMRMAGPSVASFDEIIHGDFNINLEKLDFRMDHEHDEQIGRHTTIRPDIINMFPDVAGATIRVRAASGETSGTKIIGYNSAGVGVWAFDASGRVVIGGGTLGAYDYTPDFDLSFERTNVARIGPRSELTAGSGDLYLTGNNLVADPSSFSAGSGRLRLRQSRNGVFAEEPEAVLQIAVTPTDTGLVRLDVYEDGTGDSRSLAYWDLLTGRMGLGMPQGSGVAAALPATDLHIRARSISDLELFRLEGVSDSQPTVAMSFKPMRDQDLFAFMEVDLDSGDWFWNFVMTATMESQSTSQAMMRFLSDAAGLGSGNEVMRLGNLSDGLVEVGRSFGTSDALATIPRYSSLMTAARPHVALRARGASLTEPGFSLSRQGDTFGLIYGAYLDPTNLMYRYDVGGAAGTARAYRLAVDTSAELMAFQYARSNVTAAPFASSAWDTEWGYLRSFDASTPGLFFMRNGVIGIQETGQGVNPAYTDLVVPNTLYANLMPKAALLFTMTGPGTLLGAVVLSAINFGPNIELVSWDIAARGSIRVDFATDMADTNYGVTIHIQGASGYRFDNNEAIEFRATLKSVDHFFIYAVSGNPPIGVPDLGLVTAVTMFVEVFGTQVS